MVFNSRGHRPARRGPVRGGIDHAGRSATGRRVHLHVVFPGPPPQPDRRPHRRTTGLHRLHLTLLHCAADPVSTCTALGRRSSGTRLTAGAGSVPSPASGRGGRPAGLPVPTRRPGPVGPPEPPARIPDRGSAAGARPVTSPNSASRGGTEASRFSGGLRADVRGRTPTPAAGPPGDSSAVRFSPHERITGPGAAGAWSTNAPGTATCPRRHGPIQGVMVDDRGLADRASRRGCPVSLTSGGRVLPGAG